MKIAFLMQCQNYYRVLGPVVDRALAGSGTRELVLFRHRRSRKGYSEAIVRTPAGEGDA